MAVPPAGQADIMPNERKEARETQLRETVQVRLPDGRVLEGERETPLVEFLRAAFPNRKADPPMAAIVGETLRELAWPVPRDADVTPVFLSDSDGMRIYSRSLSFLLVVAAHALFPEARVFIDYSVPYGGYFCRVENRPPFSSEELGQLKERMRTLVQEDQPIERHRLSVDEARALFLSRGEKDKVRLLADLKDEHFHLYNLDGFLDSFYGYMVPSTGCLRVFSLEPFPPEGFVLRFPRREDLTKILPPQRFTALREVFNEYGKWLDVLGVRDVGLLNEAISGGRIEQVLLVSEALHEKRIAEIARLVAVRHAEGRRLAFIAGPSSSGKTTFSRRLAIQLLAAGIHPYPIEMDDYFRPRAELAAAERPVDFDSLEALDVPLFEETLHALLAGRGVSLPRYSFKTGERETGPMVRLEKDEIVLVEGIHGLNPALLASFPEGERFRIFVSALTQLNLDSHNRVPTTDTRLLRRIVRDATYRSYTAEATLAMWESVRQGEKQNIFPYQESADVLFNSALVYELAVLKPFADPLLRQVREPRLRIEAERLLAFLHWFQPYPAATVPGNSILREFVGGSTLSAFNCSLTSALTCKDRSLQPARQLR